MTLDLTSRLLPSGGDPPDLLDVAATNEGEVMPVIRKKEREYMGMFEYDRREEMQIIRVLIYGMLSVFFCLQRCILPHVNIFWLNFDGTTNMKEQMLLRMFKIVK